MSLTFDARAADAGREATQIPRDQDRFGDRARAIGAAILDPARELFPLFPGEMFQRAPRSGGPTRARCWATSHEKRFGARRRGNGESTGGAGRARILREGRTFEAGIAQAMAAVLASPMFLFREEGLEEVLQTGIRSSTNMHLLRGCRTSSGRPCPTRSCSDWPRNTRSGKTCSAQLKRMLADPRSGEFIRNFVGQWLQARDIETVPIDAFAVISPRSAVRSRRGSKSGAIARTEP